MNTIFRTTIVSLSVSAFLLVLSGIYCSTPIGGGSEAGNAKILGKVVDSLGHPAAKVVVTARPHDYDPVKDTLISETETDTTDTEGNYHFTFKKKGMYTVDARHSSDNKRALISELAALEEDNPAPQCTLKATGTIRIQIPDSIDNTNGYVYIPGTSLYTFLNSTLSFVYIDNVPVTVLPAISYSSLQTHDALILRQDVPVNAEDTATVYNSGWKFTSKFILNTTPSGADIKENIFNFPVCIRLTSSNFPFEQTKSDGSDIRFTKTDNTPLHYEIERWDAANRIAEIWVDIDTIFGNDSSQCYLMYWGNPAATSESAGTSVFDTGTGFQGVWHLSGEGKTTEKDATANKYHGTLYSMDVSSAIDGVIGGARTFNGAGYISMLNTASGHLDMPQNGEYSISLWAYADTVDSSWHVIAGKGHEQYYLKFKCFRNTKATWEFVEFHDQQGWELTEDSIPPAPGAKQWVYLTGVHSGTHQYLYINGELVDDTLAVQTGNYARNTSDNFSIGRYLRQVSIPYAEGWCNFKGMIDEVRVMNTAVTPDWIKLSFMNQKEKDALVRFE